MERPPAPHFRRMVAAFPNGHVEVETVHIIDDVAVEEAHSPEPKTAFCASNGRHSTDGPLGQSGLYPSAPLSAMASMSRLI